MWADRKQVAYVVMAGEQEIAQGKMNLKNMKTGDQQLVSPEELIRLLSE